MKGSVNWGGGHGEILSESQLRHIVVDIVGSWLHFNQKCSQLYGY